MPDTIRGEEEYCQMIIGLCPNEEVARSMVFDLQVNVIGCVDPSTKDGDWNPPGSAVFLFLDDPALLEKFFELRAGGSVSFYTHTRCGYKYARGFRTICEQEKLVREFSDHAIMLAEKYGCTLTIVVEEVGGADPYMTAAD